MVSGIEVPLIASDDNASTAGQALPAPPLPAAALPPGGEHPLLPHQWRPWQGVQCQWQDRGLHVLHALHIRQRNPSGNLQGQIHIWQLLSSSFPGAGGCRTDGGDGLDGASQQRGGGGGVWPEVGGQGQDPGRGGRK